MSHDALLAVLKANGILPSASADAFSWELLTGGFWNRVYRLRCQESTCIDWVVKQFVKVPVNPMFPILATAEYEALRFLEGRNCAPKPIAFVSESPAGSLLVYQYVQGSAWNGDIDAAATLLARVQQLPLNAAATTAFRKLPTDPCALQEHAQAMLNRHLNSTSEAVRQFRPARPSLSDAKPVKTVLVHTDCGPGNMVSSPDGLRLIDWQCPGIGDGLQDVATFLSPAMQVLYGYPVLTDAQEHQFLETYFFVLGEQSLDRQKTQARFHRIRSSHHYRFAAYCAMRMQDTASSDEKTSRLYGAALEAELNLMQRLLS